MEPIQAPAPAPAARTFTLRIPGTVAPFSVSLEVAPDDSVIIAQDDLRSVDLRLGSTNWQYFDPEGRLGTGTFAPQIALGASAVYVAGPNFLYAVDLATGALRWRNSIDFGNVGPGPLRPAVVAAAANQPELVVVGERNGRVVAFAAEGRLAWSSDFFFGQVGVGASYFPGTVRVAETGRQVTGVVFASVHRTEIAEQPATLAALDARTGEQVWSPEDPIGLIPAAPVFDEQNAYVVSLGGQVAGPSVLRFPHAVLQPDPSSTDPFVGSENLDGLGAIAAANGAVYSTTVRGALAIQPGPGRTTELVTLADSLPSAPIVFTNLNGEGRALLVGDQPNDPRAFFILVALPVAGSPNFVVTEIDDYHAAGQLRMNQNLFAAAFIQEDNDIGPGVIVGVDASSL